MSVRETKMMIPIGKLVEASVDDQGDLCLDHRDLETPLYLNAKEARTLLRALRKFEAEGLLED